MDNWKNILDESILKTNVCFAALFVMNYECLKEYIVDQVKAFYCNNIHFEDDEIIYKESESYKKEVRELDGNIENASLKWFMKAEAITKEDYDNYQKIRKRRNEITHELLKNLNNGFIEKDVELFSILLDLYGKIDRWWINEIEIPTSADEIPKDYDKNGVYSGQALILNIINDIVLKNEGDKDKDILDSLLKDL